MFCVLPYVVSLDSSLMRKNKGNFLCSTYHLVEHPGGRSFRFPVCVGIDIHGSSYIGVSQKLLHILRCYAVGQQIGGEGMSEQMEMKLSQVWHYLSCPAADTAYRCRGFKGSVWPYTDHGQFLIPLRYFFRSRQAVHLVVDPVLFLHFLIVVEGVKGAVLQAVFVEVNQGRNLLVQNDVRRIE